MKGIKQHCPICLYNDSKKDNDNFKSVIGHIPNCECCNCLVEEAEK